jgi:hypothetical protein
MSIEIRRSLVLSMAHITPEMDASLEAFANDDQTIDHLDLSQVEQLSFDAVTYGYQIFVPEEALEVDVAPMFAPMFALARKHNCTWIVLDRDADVCDDLPVWEW